MSESEFVQASWQANWNRRQGGKAMTKEEKDALDKRFDDAMSICEEAVMEADRKGHIIHGARARAENLGLDCVDMARNGNR